MTVVACVEALQTPVFAAEPGLYHEKLRAGLRIEEDYLVTASGVEKLTHFPTRL